MSYEKNVRRVIPYTPGEQPNQPDMVKLNTNECPYPPSPAVAAAAAALDCDAMRLYPDPSASVLVDALAESYGVKPSQVFVGVGSDDVLAMIFLTFFNSDAPIFFPDITYSFYDVWADLYRIPYETKALDEDFLMKKEDYMGEKNGGIIFPNPNAPTGILMPLSDIEAIVAANPDVICVVDEAYIDFGGVSALPLIEKYDNLLVVQTFSKSRAMAGIRIGYAFGHERLIKYLNDVKFSFNSYTMNRPSLTMGVASLQDDAYFKDITARIKATRENAKKRLAALGFTFGDSMANFIFATHATMPAEEIYAALRQRAIYVRYFKKPRIDNYLRITIGTDAEMEKLFGALEEILSPDKG